MADEATAVLEPENAAPPEAPPEEALPETESGQDAPEAEAPETPETEAEPNPFEGKSFEEIAALIREEEKANLKVERDRRWAELEANAKKEAEKTASQTIANQQYQLYQSFQQHGLIPRLEGIVKDAVYKGEESLDKYGQQLEQLATAFQWAAEVPLRGQLRQAMLATLKDEQKADPTPDQVKAIDAAVGNRDFGGVAKSYAEVVRAAVREEVRAEVEAEMRAEKKTAQLREVEASRSGQPRPTNVSGGGGRRRSMTNAEIEAMPMREWLAIPEAERERLLAEAK